MQVRWPTCFCRRSVPHHPPPRGPPGDPEAYAQHATLICPPDNMALRTACVWQYSLHRHPSTDSTQSPHPHEHSTPVPCPLECLHQAPLQRVDGIPQGDQLAVLGGQLQGQAPRLSPSGADLQAGIMKSMRM